ncbi:hypothetical protein BDR03DRAFT_978842 [Suillus americanus]|nr:hypothetical protein BDR03DRAFT_978842 [Suillus americanus]
MPIRRLSVSAEHGNPAQSSNRAHRSNDSHHILTGNGGPIHPPSIAYSGASTTPQQKMVVQALINNRIKNKLPINSGLSLDIVESDPATQRAVCALVEIAHDSLDIIAWSLSELLERLAKQVDADGQMTTEALQSQLFILKILSVCMTSRWNHRHEQDDARSCRGPKPQNGSQAPGHVESPMPSSSQHGKKIRQASTEFSSSTLPPWTEAYPLDDNCARYILSVMVLYLRQTAAPEARLMSSSNLAPDASLHDFESVDLPTESSAFDDYTGKDGPLLPPHISHGPKPILKLRNSSASFQSAASATSGHWQLGRTFQFERTHMALVKSALALNLLISKFAGRIVYHLSASNCGYAFETFTDGKWSIVIYSRFATTLCQTSIKLRAKGSSCVSDVLPVPKEPLTPETSQRPLSPAESMVPSETKYTSLHPQYPSSHFSSDVEESDLDHHSLLTNPNQHSRAVQTDSWLGLHPMPSLNELVSTFPHDGRSDTSSFQDGQPSHLSALLERIMSLLLRMSQADALTLTNRLKRQHLRGADVKHLSRATTSSMRLSEYDNNGAIRRAASRPKAKRFTSETLIDKDLMLLSILALLRASPDYYIANIEDTDVEGWDSISSRVRDSDTDTAVKISAATSHQHLTDLFFKMPPTDPYYKMIERPMSLMCIAKRLLLTRLDPDSQRLWIHVAHQLVECYHRKSEDNHAHGMQFDKDRVPAFAMCEIAFLVSLTSVSSDVSQLAAQGLRLIAQAERQPGAPVNHGLTEEERSKRNPIYEQLGDPSVIIVGRVREQKRVRKLLRLVANSSPINIAVWEECFYRWSALSEFIGQNSLAAAAAFDDSHLSKHEQLMSLEDKFFQWRNLTLFLAAFGGVTVQEKYDHGALTVAISPEFLLDDMRSLRDPADLVAIFIEFLTGALIDDVVRVREVAREALGSELSPRLFSKLFRHLDEITRNITAGAGLEFKDEYGLFLDQLISVLKSLVENAQMPPDEALSIDLGSILHILVGFISRFSDPVSYRIRVKFCALCDSICHRTDTLTLRKDDLSRNRIIDIVMDWFQDPTLNTDPEAIQFQYELNFASLRTVVKLLERLKLQPIDNNSNDGDDSGHVVSRLFIRYSHGWE